ncbi:MAG: hypothetical protein RNU03_20940 [Candidatus Sedimenticola sp. (ex Thyasira tokunagai)]
MYRSQTDAADVRINATDGGTVTLTGISAFSDNPNGNGSGQIQVSAATGIGSHEVDIPGITDINNVAFHGAGRREISGQLQTATNSLSVTVHAVPGYWISPS